MENIAYFEEAKMDDLFAISGGCAICATGAIICGACALGALAAAVCTSVPVIVIATVVGGLIGYGAYCLASK